MRSSHLQARKQILAPQLQGRLRASCLFVYRGSATPIFIFSTKINSVGPFFVLLLFPTGLEPVTLSVLTIRYNQLNHEFGQHRSATGNWYERLGT